MGELYCWPEVPIALRSARKVGIRVAFLSNMTAQKLESAIRNSRLDGAFDHVLSTDRVKAYKPDPRAYQMGVTALGCHATKSSLPLTRVGMLPAVSHSDIPPSGSIAKTRAVRNSA